MWNHLISSLNPCLTELHSPLDTSQSKLPLFMHLERKQHCRKVGALQIPVKLFVCEALLTGNHTVKDIIIQSWLIKREKGLPRVALEVLLVRERPRFGANCSAALQHPRFLVLMSHSAWNRCCSRNTSWLIHWSSSKRSRESQRRATVANHVSP